MLKLNPNPTFTWPIMFKSAEGEHTLKLIFRHMPVDQYNAWWAEAVKVGDEFKAAFETYKEALAKATSDGTSPPEMPKPRKTPLQEIMEIVAGWEEVDTPFSAEAMQAMLNNYHSLTTNLIYFGWIEGLEQRKLEN